MKREKVVIPALIGTSAMTAFSYLVSDLKERNFKEPELLARLSQELLPATERTLAVPAGWFGHYSMGVAWAVLARYLMESGKLRADLKSSMQFGVFGGITGVVIWKMMFKFHSNPPRIAYRRFYGHLLLAHLVYSITLVLASKKLP